MPGGAVAEDTGQEKTRVVGLRDIHLSKLIEDELVIQTCDLGPEIIETVQRVSQNSESIKLRTYSVRPYDSTHVKIEELECNLVDVYDDAHSSLKDTLIGAERWYFPGEQNGN